MRFALILFLFFTNLSWAAFQNRQLLPVGEREMFLANTGAAGNPSLGAVYFNPANLALIRYPSLSLTGTTYLKTESEISPLVKADGANLNYSSSGFDTIPTTVASAWQVGYTTIAFALMVPDAQKLENRQTFKTANTQTTLDQIQGTRDLWAGLSVGGYLGDGLSIGMTVWGMQHADSSSLVLTIRNTTTANTISVSQLRLQSNIYNFAATFGARWEVFPFLDLGLRIQTRAFRIAGKADGYRFTQSVSGTSNISIDEKEQKGIYSHYPLPTDGTLGVKFKFSNINLLFDVSLQEGSSYDLYPNSEFSTLERLSQVFRYNLGVEIEITPKFSMCFGGFLNPSAIPSLVDRPEGTIKQTFYGGTGGLTFLSGRVRTGIGFYVTKSLGDVIPYGAPTETGIMSQTSLGGAIVISYYL